MPYLSPTLPVTTLPPAYRAFLWYAFNPETRRQSLLELRLAKNALLAGETRAP